MFCVRQNSSVTFNSSTGCQSYVAFQLNTCYNKGLSYLGLNLLDGKMKLETLLNLVTL